MQKKEFSNQTKLENYCTVIQWRVKTHFEFSVSTSRSVQFMKTVISGRNTALVQNSLCIKQKPSSQKACWFFRSENRIRWCATSSVWFGRKYSQAKVPKSSKKSAKFLHNRGLSISRIVSRLFWPRAALDSPQASWPRDQSVTICVSKPGRRAVLETIGNPGSLCVTRRNLLCGELLLLS